MSDPSVSTPGEIAWNTFSVDSINDVSQHSNVLFSILLFVVFVFGPPMLYATPPIIPPYVSAAPAPP